MPKRVAVLCFPPAPVFEMAVACEVFGIDRTAMGVPRCAVRVCTPEPRHALPTAMGCQIKADSGLRALAWADLVVVPGWPHVHDGTPVPPQVLAALRRAHARGARLASVCSGAFVLAATGLLDGARATTHWMYAEHLAEQYPQIAVDPDVLYVGDGQLFTSAGTAAGIDLCLHLARLDHGAEVAATIARRMVVPPHRDGGQSQYIESPVQPSDDGDFSALLHWLSGRLHENVTVEAMARRARMSPRTFARRFRQATGTTPVQWLLQQRVHHAQRLLETTSWSIDRVADKSGFGTAANLRIHFGRVVGTSPSAYRSAFGRRRREAS